MSQGLTGSGNIAPKDATYIVQTANGTLTNEQALSALATGVVKNTTGTGVLSIAAEGTDYYSPGGTDVAVTDGGTGASTAAGARTNLGLGTIATQDSNNVSITGGSISGITLTLSTDLAVAEGGTGASSFTQDEILTGNGTSALTSQATTSENFVLGNQIFI